LNVSATHCLSAVIDSQPVPMARLFPPGFRYARVACLFLLRSLFCAWYCVGQGTTPAEDRLNAIFSQAQQAQQRGDYRSAADAYEKIAELRPDIGEVWANVGLMHQFLQEYSQAENAFQVALRKNPRLFVPNLFLGLNRLRMQQPRNALRYLKAAVDLNPQDEQAALGLARAYAMVEDNHSAAKWFERARQINPGDVDAWYGLGVSYLRLQDAAVRQLGKLNPNDVHARALVADAFVEQGRTNDAIKIYEQFRSSPQPPCLMAALGFAYAQLGAAFKARSAFQDDIQNRSGCFLAHLGLARLAMTDGDFAIMLRELIIVFEADQNFLRANMQRVWQGANDDQLSESIRWLRQVSPEQRDFAFRLADFMESGKWSVTAPTGSSSHPNPSVPDTPQKLWAEGRYTACTDKLRRQKAPRSATSSSLLEQCTFYSGDYRAGLEASESALHVAPGNFAALYWEAKSAQELAAAALAQASAVAPESSKVHLLLAELHRSRGEFGAAEAEYRADLRSGGEEVPARLGLAQLYNQNSEDDKALEQLNDALKSDSSNPEVNALLGQILVRRHQFDEAVPHLKIGLNGSPLSLPQLHSLLARCYAADGEYARALEELKPALSADLMGTFHYQLYQIYQKLGDQRSAAAALRKSEQLRREKLEAEQRQRLPPEP
jgi:tetratricopeptide (TPR) repeat protein